MLSETVITEMVIEEDFHQNSKYVNHLPKYTWHLLQMQLLVSSF